MTKVAAPPPPVTVVVAPVMRPVGSAVPVPVVNLVASRSSLASWISAASSTADLVHQTC